MIPSKVRAETKAFKASKSKEQTLEQRSKLTTYSCLHEKEALARTHRDIGYGGAHFITERDTWAVSCNRGHDNDELQWKTL